MWLCWPHRGQRGIFFFSFSLLPDAAEEVNCRWNTCRWYWLAPPLEFAVGIIYAVGITVEIFYAVGIAVGITLCVRHPNRTRSLQCCVEERGPVCF